MIGEMHEEIMSTSFLLLGYAMRLTQNLPDVKGHPTTLFKGNSRHLIQIRMKEPVKWHYGSLTLFRTRKSYGSDSHCSYPSEVENKVLQMPGVKPATTNKFPNTETYDDD